MLSVKSFESHCLSFIRPFLLSPDAFLWSSCCMRPSQRSQRDSDGAVGARVHVDARVRVHETQGCRLGGRRGGVGVARRGSYAGVCEGSLVTPRQTLKWS